jgi:hydroxymethylbilane synthase
VLIARPPAPIAELPKAAVIGTSSVRRKAQLLARRSDLRVVDFRGNVDSRLRKLAAGEVDATLLALAGLRRLGIDDAGMVVLTPAEMLPAVGQGAIGIECRADDAASLALLAAIDHPASAACVRAERALLAALDGSCHTPIAGHAEIAAGRLHLRALVARPDGSACLRAERAGLSRDAERLGEDAGAELRARAGPAFFD